MTLGGSTPLTRVMTVRQTVEPGNPLDGMMWINPAGGANGNNSERYLWNASAGAWELTSSTGPDTPLYPVSGALWRDTANSLQKSYDGAAWQNVGVTDHANLSNVQPNQHHAPSWTLDGSISVANVASVSYTMSQTYDRVAIVIDHATGHDSGDSFNDLTLTLDGVGTGYDLLFADGTTNGGSSFWYFGPDAYSSAYNFSGTLYLSGTSSVRVGNSGVGRISAKYMPTGLANDVVPPVDSFEFKYQTGNITLDARVYGFTA